MTPGQKRMLDRLRTHLRERGIKVSSVREDNFVSRGGIMHPKGTKVTQVTLRINQPLPDHLARVWNDRWRERKQNAARVAEFGLLSPGAGYVPGGITIEWRNK